MGHKSEGHFPLLLVRYIWSQRAGSSQWPEARPCSYGKLCRAWPLVITCPWILRARKRKTAASFLPWRQLHFGKGWCGLLPSATMQLILKHDTLRAKVVQEFYAATGSSDFNRTVLDPRRDGQHRTKACTYLSRGAAHPGAAVSLLWRRHLANVCTPNPLPIL